MTISTAPEAPVDARLAPTRTLRGALFYGHDPRARPPAARLALAGGVEVVADVSARDPRTFAELAQALRDAAPDIVIASVREPKDADGIRESLEALRFGCAAMRPLPRVLALADPKLAARIRPAAMPFEFEAFADPAEVVRSIRAERRAGAAGATIREDLLEDAARALAQTTTADALVVDVSERTSSCVLARPDGTIDAAHVAGVGVGAADRVLARAGIDRVRRWIPWSIDNPALLERVFNRSRWPNAIPATELALAVEMAVAREAIALVLRDVDDAGLAARAMRAAPSVLASGRAAAFPRAMQTLLVVIDALEPAGVTCVWREPDDGHAERLALVAPVAPRRTASVRIDHPGGRSEERIARGGLSVVAVRGNVALSGAVRGHGEAGTLGVVIDARGRPLVLPARDNERLPALGRWNASIGAFRTRS